MNTQELPSIDPEKLTVREFESKYSPSYLIKYDHEEGLLQHDGNTLDEVFLALREELFPARVRPRS